MELYEALIEHSVDGLLLTRPDGSVLRASPSACRILGRSEEEIRRLGRNGLLVQDEKLEALLREREATGVVQGELAFLRADGSTFPAEVTSAIIRTGSTRRYAYVIFRDVTERARAERALRESEALHRTLFLLAPSGVVLSDVEGRMLAFNERAHAQLGYSSEEFARLAVSELEAGDFPGDHEVRVARARAGEEVEFETQQRTRAGEIRDVLVRMRALPASDEVRLLSVWHDITEANMARRELSRSEQRFRALIEHASEVIMVLDVDRAIRFFSPSATEALGFSAKEIIGRPFLDLIHPDDQPSVLEAHECALASGGATERFTCRYLHRDGSWRLLEGIGHNLLDDPSVRGFVVNARDVTRARALEQQARQAQKMESLGRLAEGVAHDFSNLLTVIMSCAETLRALPVGDTPEAQQELREIAGAGERGREFIRQLLAVARRGPSSSASTDLNELLTEHGAWLGRVLGADVELALTLAPSPLRVRCSPGLVQQILLNLATNAREAMPQGGSLTIAVERVEVGPGDAVRPLDLPPGAYVVLRVADTGHGMAPEAKAHAFEPFFTTKPGGHRSGLGLATILGIVGQHGGSVLLESEPGKGTVVGVYLPEQREEGRVPERPGARDMTGWETVLLLEDDETLRDTVARALRGNGYRVLTALDLREALKLVDRDSNNEVHLILADVILPGPHGAAGALELRRRYPQACVLYMSGYTLESIVERGLLDRDVEFLEKPFAISELLARVRRILDRKGAPAG